MFSLPRLPIIQGGSFAFLLPAFSIFSLRGECPTKAGEGLISHGCKLLYMSHLTYTEHRMLGAWGWMPNGPVGCSCFGGRYSLWYRGWSVRKEKDDRAYDITPTHFRGSKTYIWFLMIMHNWIFIFLKTVFVQDSRVKCFRSSIFMIIL